MSLKAKKIMSVPDEELYQLLSSDKKKATMAFDELYRRYSAKLFTYCCKILMDEAKAQDIFQEAFLRFYESAKKDRNMTNVSAFLFKIARNLSLNEKQKKHNSFISYEDIQHSTFDKSYESKEQVELLEMALDNLEEKYKEAFVLREYLGMSYQEIGEMLELSLSTVRIRIYRAKNKIREFLAPYIEDLENNQ